jgi:hypothetical protein
MNRQHDIIWFELDYKNIIPNLAGLPENIKKVVEYLIQGTLFIGSELYALVMIYMRIRDTKTLVSPVPSRIYLINMSKKQVADYIEYDGGSITFDGRLLASYAIDVYKIDNPRMSEYIIYGITNSAKIQKLREFKLHTFNSSHSMSGNTFMYLDEKNNLMGFKYNPDIDSTLDFPPTLITELSTALKAGGCPLLINSFSDTNKYLVLEYSEYVDTIDNQPMFLIDISAWPPRFKYKYVQSEIDPSYERKYLNKYIDRAHKPANILTVFPELFIGMPEEDIPDYVLDFQLVAFPDRREPDGIRHSYEIVILAKTPEKDMLPKLPICGYDINTTPATLKIINTHLGELVIDGGGIFKLVENEYRKTLTRMQVPSANYTSGGLDKFIHPFGRMIYSQTGRDGILELNHNRTHYKNIIQGYYICVLLPNVGAAAKYRIKIIGYYPKRVGEKKVCPETGDEFVYQQTYYSDWQTHASSLTLFYSSFVRRMRARFYKALLGHLPDLLINTISQFYVLNKYCENITRVNPHNELVPLLGL